MLLWRKAPRVWKAKGYTHTTAADALEAEFGTGKKLGRTPISLLVKTRCEPCPPEVERFILDTMPVLNQETWAKYLAEVANESPEDDADPLVLEPHDFREVAQEVAAEVANTVRGWLDTLGNTLGLLASSEAKLDAAHGKLDGANARLGTLQATLNHADAKIDLLIAKLDNQKARRDRMALVCGLGFAVLITCQHASSTAPSAAPAPQVVNVNFGTGLRADESARSGARSEPEKASQELRSDAGASMGQRNTGHPLPHTRLRWSGHDQAAAPCEGSETTLYGLCWTQTSHSAPCPPDQYQEEEKCYKAIFVAPERKPASETTQPLKSE